MYFFKLALSHPSKQLPVTSEPRPVPVRSRLSNIDHPDVYFSQHISKNSRTKSDNEKFTRLSQNLKSNLCSEQENFHNLG